MTRTVKLLACIAVALWCLLAASYRAHAEEQSSVWSFFTQGSHVAALPAKRHHHSTQPAQGRPGPATGAPSHGIYAMVTEAARRHGVPPAIAHAVVKTESRYDCHAHSPSGALGIMQVLPATARGVGVHGPLTDCATGLEAGMRYLRQVLASRGDQCTVLSRYEGGLGVHHCSGYGRMVISRIGFVD